MISVRGDHGGGPAHMHLLTKLLAADFEIHVAIPHEPPYWHRFESLLGESRLIAIPHRKFQPGSLWQLTRETKRRNIDLIHSHGKGAGLYGRLAALLTGRPAVHSFHGVHLGSYGWLTRSLYLMLERTLSSLTKKVIATSPSEAQLITRLRLVGSEKLVTIENGIDLTQVDAPSLKRDTIFHVVTITRFDYAKNPELLSEIIELSLKDHNSENIVFDVIGDGEGSALVRERLNPAVERGQVIFHGNVDDARPILSSANCYLSTSRWEGLPLGLLEAFAYSLPVVATKVTGNSDLVEDGVTGLLYGLDEPERAASHIFMLQRDESLAERLGRAGRELVARKYSAEEMAVKTSRLYREVLGRGY